MALFASLLATGCSGGGFSEAKQEKSPPPNAQERAYYKCLEKNGLTLETRDDSQLRVDKDKNDNASMVSAEAKCADLLPDEASAAPAPSAFVAKVRKFSACVRENGFPEYPDPDPTTGQVDASVDQAEKYQTPEFVVAAKKCSPA
ncbi:hypothetical protein [Streptomyces sp. NPDC079189]|uniref:hypothetical protein n=1 Tax=Streptomyces sp. NPDC079189 TaxID=3154514 RepID=UPI00341F1612